MAFSKSQQKVIAAKRPESNYVGGSCEGNMYEKFRKHDTTQRRVYKMFVKGHKLNARRVWGEQLLKVMQHSHTHRNSGEAQVRQNTGSDGENGKN